MMRFNKRLFAFLFICSMKLLSQSLTFYVDPTTGNDSNSGAIDKPFLTLNKGVSVLTSNNSGTLYLRGGTYILSSNLKPNKNGSSSDYFNLWAYPGEKAVLDFSTETFGSKGIYLSVNYWYVKGLEIKNSGDNGVYIFGSYNIVENCDIHDNQDTGLQIDGGAHDNKILNCDSYYNADPGQGNADGFSPKLGVGTGNYFFGCRAWQNSDDGWDGYLRTTNDVSTVLENCWSFKNGYLKNGAASQGNGNGFKMGGSDNKDLMHNFTLKNCIAFDNRVKGFDQNNNLGSMTLYNCTAYRNGSYNFSAPSNLNSGKTLTIKNSISLSQGINIFSSAIQECNSWMPTFAVTNTDFISVDPISAFGPRKPDGSLPDINFLHLASGSKLIDSGSDVGIPFKGIAPDLGAFEFDPTIPSDVEKIISLPSEFILLQNYPNPFNPETTVEFQIPRQGRISIKIFDINGIQIIDLYNGLNSAGSYKVRWNGMNDKGSKAATGIYFCIVRFENSFRGNKLLLLK